MKLPIAERWRDHFTNKKPAPGSQGADSFVGDYFRGALIYDIGERRIVCEVAGHESGSAPTRARRQAYLQPLSTDGLGAQLGARNHFPSTRITKMAMIYVLSCSWPSSPSGYGPPPGPAGAFTTPATRAGRHEQDRGQRNKQRRLIAIGNIQSLSHFPFACHKARPKGPSEMRAYLFARSLAG